MVVSNVNNSKSTSKPQSILTRYCDNTEICYTLDTSNTNKPCRNLTQNFHSPLQTPPVVDEAADVDPPLVAVPPTSTLDWQLTASFKSHLLDIIITTPNTSTCTTPANYLPTSHFIPHNPQSLQLLNHPSLYSSHVLIFYDILKFPKPNFKLAPDSTDTSAYTPKPTSLTTQSQCQPQIHHLDP